MTKHDYQDAHDFLNRMFEHSHKQCEQAAIPLSKEVINRERAALHALKLAAIVTGEPTHEMHMGEARDALLRDRLSRDITKAETICTIFKAMIAEAQRQAEGV